MILKIKSNDHTYSLDLYTFAKRVLGYTLLEKEPHKTWCQELDQRPPRVMTLEPRHTYKSTLYSKAYPIWRLFENPNLRILLTSAVTENVQNFLSEISGHYLRNPRLIELYRAKYNKAPLSPLAEKKKKITLAVRTINHSEPSIAAIGALGNLVSAHYDLIIVDDLCNEDDRESPALREKKKRWFQDLFSVLSPKGQIVLVGTRWHFNDAYGDIITKLNPALPSEYKFKIRVESCYLEDGSTPRFPNILSANRLEALKTEVGPLLFACNYLNQPLAAEAQIFHLEDMVTTPKTKIDLSQTQAFGYCDPSGGSTDWSAIVTLLVQPDSTWVVFSSYFSHHAHSELITEIIRSHKFFNYKIFGIEGNTLKAKSDTAVSNFEHVLREQQAERGVVVPYKLIWHNIPKDARIKSIEPYYVNGQLKFLDSWNADYPELITELVQFPLAAHNDGPDALEGVISLVLNQPKEPEVLHPRVR